jgi:CDP-diacylglycerol pyrophosphatase
VKGRKVAVIAVVAATLGLAVGAVIWVWYFFSNPDELWIVVKNCVAAKKHGHTLRAGCLSVDLQNNVAILPGIVGRTHYLAVPTIRITGIEDPRLRDPNLPNYWALAWAAAYRYLPRSATRYRTNVGLAINSVEGRSQNQLHIHIACLRRGIRRQLAAEGERVNGSWSEPTLNYGPQQYRIMHVSSPTLKSVNPFLLLFNAPGAAKDIGSHTLLVTGALSSDGKNPGFYILDDYAHDTPDGPDTGHAEDLLDENCRS